MKKIILLIVLFPLFGVNQKESVVVKKEFFYVKRPTLEQQLQLAKNQLNLSYSRFDVKLAEIKNN